MKKGYRSFIITALILLFCAIATLLSLQRLVTIKRLSAIFVAAALMLVINWVRVFGDREKSGISKKLLAAFGAASFIPAAALMIFALLALLKLSN